MNPQATAPIVRVTHSRELIEQATATAWEKKRDGYSAEALVLAVDEILQDAALSRAIVLFVQTSPDDAAIDERPMSCFSLVMSLAFGFFSLWLVVYLFGFVKPDTSFLTVILIVVGQALSLKFFQRSIRLAVTSAIDWLNEASYPTRLHPMRLAPSLVGSIRLRRLRALVCESADRLRAGEKRETIQRELAEVNLTERAAAWVMLLARLNAATRDYLPPYESRWMGYTLALAFIVTCIVFIERSRGNLADGYRNYAVGVTGWIAGDLAARPRRRPRSLAS